MIRKKRAITAFGSPEGLTDAILEEAAKTAKVNVAVFYEETREVLIKAITHFVSMRTRPLRSKLKLVKEQLPLFIKGEGGKE